MNGVPHFKRRFAVAVEDGSFQVPLTRGLFATIDAQDVRLVTRHTWQALPAPYTFYAVSACNRAGQRWRIWMSRLILDVGDELQVDHADRNGFEQ